MSEKKTWLTRLSFGTVEGKDAACDECKLPIDGKPGVMWSPDRHWVARDARPDLNASTLQLFFCSFKCWNNFATKHGTLKGWGYGRKIGDGVSKKSG